MRILRPIAVASLLLALLAALVMGADSALPPDLTRYHARSLVLLDREAEPFDVTLASDGAWRIETDPSDVDPAYLRLLLAIEDARFERHPGVDPLALARAAWQLVTHGHVVSGGSTLTMQVARLLEPHRHDVAGKLRDIVRALQLEAHYSKRQILSMYLTLAPFGGNIEGVRAASLRWFGHEPRHLTPGEAALLVALPRSPERFRPDRNPDRAREAARRVLLRADPGQAEAGLPVLAAHAFPAEARHLADRLWGHGLRGSVATTVDASLQRALTALAGRERLWMNVRANVAVLAVRNADRSVLAYLGGADYFGPQGMVDMVRARRSPGSALKPFIYGLAFDDGLVRPETLIDDLRTRIGDYAPHDFDGTFQGPVTVRTALQQSLNLPAVKLLAAVGPQRLVDTLRQAGATLTLPRLATGAHLPVALGGVGIDLWDLAMLYADLANDGHEAALRLISSDLPGRGGALMTGESAGAIGDIMRGSPPPEGVAASGNRAVAFKTGTSYGFRDAWAVGFSGRYTVAVWTGRTDGTPLPGSYGRATAAPLLFRVFDLLPAEPDVDRPLPVRPARTVSAHFGRTGRLGPEAPRIVFPPPGATLERGDASRPIALEAAGGAPPYRWLIDGIPLPRQPIGVGTSWTPADAGFVRISVVDSGNQATSLEVRVLAGEK